MIRSVFKYPDIRVLIVFLAISVTYAAEQCPKEHNLSNDILLVHNDCGKFYKCTFGRLVEMVCPAGLYFNPKNLKCDWKQNVDCRRNESVDNHPKFENTEIVPDYNNKSEDKLKLDDSNQMDETSANKFSKNGCPINSSTHWLLPHEDNCNLFYYCVHGEKLLRYCPSSLHFNVNLQVCDWPDRAGCADSSESETEDSQEDNNSQEGKGSQENDKSQEDKSTSQEESQEHNNSQEGKDSQETDKSEEDKNTSQEESQEHNNSQEGKDSQETDKSEEDKNTSQEESQEHNNSQEGKDSQETDKSEEDKNTSQEESQEHNNSQEGKDSQETDKSEEDKNTSQEESQEHNNSQEGKDSQENNKSQEDSNSLEDTSEEDSSIDDDTMEDDSSEELSHQKNKKIEAIVNVKLKSVF